MIKYQYFVTFHGGDWDGAGSDISLHPDLQGIEIDAAAIAYGQALLDSGSFSATSVSVGKISVDTGLTSLAELEPTE